MLLKQLIVVWSLSWVVRLWSKQFETMQWEKRGWKNICSTKHDFYPKSFPLSPQSTQASSFPRNVVLKKWVYVRTWRNFSWMKRNEMKWMVCVYVMQSRQTAIGSKLQNNKDTVCAGEHSCFVQKLLSFLWQFKGFLYTLVSRDFLIVC